MNIKQLKEVKLKLNITENKTTSEGVALRRRAGPQEGSCNIDVAHKLRPGHGTSEKGEDTTTQSEHLKIERAELNTCLTSWAADFTPHDYHCCKGVHRALVCMFAGSYHNVSLVREAKRKLRNIFLRTLEFLTYAIGNDAIRALITVRQPTCASCGRVCFLLG